MDVKVKRSTRAAPAAWITLYGALTGVTALIPIFPYVGGGGYVPLLVPFAAMGPLLLGMKGGVVAAIIGGLIGMFLAPGAFPLGLVDVLITSVSAAVMTGLVLHADRLWKAAIPVAVLVALFSMTFPYYIPGGAAGFEAPPQPLYWALSAYYWLPSLIVLATPLGMSLVPSWRESEDRTKRYLGIFIVMLAGFLLWWNPWTRPYWYLFNYPVGLGIATLIGYTWWVPALAAITTVITAPILEALKRSGLPKIEGAIW